MLCAFIFNHDKADTYTLDTYIQLTSICVQRTTYQFGDIRLHIHKIEKNKTKQNKTTNKGISVLAFWFYFFRFA